MLTLALAGGCAVTVDLDCCQTIRRHAGNQAAVRFGCVSVNTHDDALAGFDANLVIELRGNDRRISIGFQTRIPTHRVVPRVVPYGCSEADEGEYQEPDNNKTTVGVFCWHGKNQSAAANSKSCRHARMPRGSRKSDVPTRAASNFLATPGRVDGVMPLSATRMQLAGS
jgi:hypothetical protein